MPASPEKLMALSKYKCNAVYICPKKDGKRIGPLVPYAGKTADGKNYVGDIYFNFRRIERHPRVVSAFAEVVCAKLDMTGQIDEFNIVCGIPNGGRSLGQEIARILQIQFIYPERKAKPTATGSKQEYEWDLSQFDLTSADSMLIVEDVFNNFQNTDATLEQVARTGARVVALAGALNRSPHHDNYYQPTSGALKDQTLDIIAAIREPYPEYAQTDPEVAADIAAGNLEMEVKKNWKRLVEISA